VNETCGDFIKKHRLLSGFRKQKALADKTGISAATISRIENNIQVPEVRTVQTLSEVLTSTSYVELMLACGYWNEEDLLNGEYEGTSYTAPQVARALNEIIKKETPASIEEEFIKSIELSDEEIIKEFDLKIDGQALTTLETKGIIAYIRSLRQQLKS
jgi:transcriptional regulator with XRE-family HTH domain